MGVPRRGSGSNTTLRSRTSPPGSGGCSSPMSCATCPTSTCRRPCSVPRSSTPILVAPTAMHRFFTDDGELATARAAAEVGTVYVVSMAATTSVEDVAARAPGRPALGPDVHVARPRPHPGARRTCAGRRVPRHRGLGRRRRGRARHRQRVGRSPHPSTVGALPEPRGGRRRRQLRHHGDGHRLRPLDHVRRPGAVRRVERAPVRREGPVAGRRRGPCPGRRRRRRSRCRTTAAGCSTASPRPPTCSPTWSTRSRAGPRSTSTAACAAGPTWSRRSPSAPAR